MDIQLQELIDKIKLDGVATAEEEAAKIISEAENLHRHRARGRKNAARNIEKAKLEAERLEKASVDAIAQASRNVLLTFRENVVKELNALLKMRRSRHFLQIYLNHLFQR